MIFLLMILAGLIGGLIGGMGMGGGTLLIPILTFGLGFDQKLAQGINLISFVPMAIVVLVLHSKNKLVNWRVLPYIALPALITAIPSSFFAGVIDVALLQKSFGVFLLVLGVANITYFFKREWAVRKRSFKYSHRGQK